MTNKLAAIGLGAVIAFAPLAALAQTEQLAQAATTEAAPAAAAPTSSKARHRHRHNQSKQRARAGAHHMHKMRTTPAAPAEAPKT